MSDNPKFKELFTMTLLLITIGWAAFAVAMTIAAMQNATSDSILVASGTDTLLGSLLTWNALTIQYWFRKKPNESDGGGSTTITTGGTTNADNAGTSTGG